MAGLTPKQEAFCLAFIETGNASEAYRRAYNAENTKPDVVNVKASQMLAHGKISVRVAELKASHVDRHNITVNDILDQLDEDRLFARTLEVPAAAISATMGKAKLLGFLTEKVDLSGTMKVVAASPLDERI